MTGSPEAFKDMRKREEKSVNDSLTVVSTITWH